LRRSDPRAVNALANAIEGALDTWEARPPPAWADALTDSRAVAEAIIALLPQFGYAVSAISEAGSREEPLPGKHIGRRGRSPKPLP
jgi:hypothetical protein